ncbi:orotidine-5'-phosphate decarboxylase [Marinobacteraceae bacterium S3BR75-40.1]
MDPRIIVALDYNSREPALELVDQLDPALCRLKVGKEMFTRFGPQWVDVLQQRGFEVFLDLKFHDIPNTVARAVEAAADLGVWMVNVHASGGRRMMLQCAEALARRSGSRPYLIAVTVLTSMATEDLRELGFSQSPEELVSRWAVLTRDCGLDGVVCSARESRMLRDQLGDGFLKVTPGIRPAFAAQGDQQRIMTPADALAAGSDYLVVGRPVTQADNPLSALQAIQAEIQT